MDLLLLNILCFPFAANQYSLLSRAERRVNRASVRLGQNGRVDKPEATTANALSVRLHL